MAAAFEEWRLGWRTVACGTIGMTFDASVASITGVVMGTLTAKFGWSRALVTSNVLICAALTLLLAPFAARLMAKHGVRRCAIASVLAAVPGVVLIAAAGGSPLTWIGAWIVFGVINVGLGPLIWSTAVAGLFDKARGIALAITLTGSGISFILFPPLALAALGAFGWRGVYLSLALLFLVVLLPLTLMLFRDRAYLTGSAIGPQIERPTGRSFTVGQALRRRHFWQLAGLCSIVAGVEGAMLIHLFPVLTEAGLVPARAAGITSLVGVAMIVGRLLVGFLLDRLPAPQVVAGSILAILSSCLFARAFIGGELRGAAIALLLGLGSGGTTNAVAYLTSRYFGMTAYPAIFGLLMGIFSVGFGIAPVLAALAREAAGSYQPLFAGFAAMLVVGLALALSMGRPPARLSPAIRTKVGNATAV